MFYDNIYYMTIQNGMKKAVSLQVYMHMLSNKINTNKCHKGQLHHYHIVN